MSARRVVLLALALAGASVAAPAAAAPPAPSWRTSNVARASGLVQGEPGSPVREVDLGAIEMPGAPWLRVVFGRCALGDSSRILLRSAWDDAWQLLDARALADWGNTSAVFNGDRVEVRLLVAPGDRDVEANVRGAVVGVGMPQAPQTQCGADDNRVASSDNRVARIFNSGCTAWRIGNGAFLTAGHCADFDPDQGGPMLPDGVLDLSGVVEFNVPASQSNGTLVAAAPEDQFPINVGNVQWRFDGEGQGLGKDWCVFRVNANATTGLLPHQVYGQPFRITRELPGNGSTLRVTGFGTDTGADNQTNQTSTGPFSGEVTSGADIRLDYAVDTEGGNSGSPVIWETVGIAIGVHTNGGCTTSGGNNAGTSFEVDALENAINAVPGAGSTHVDANHPVIVPESGSLLRPWNTIGEGISAVATGATVSVFAGYYTLAAGTTLTRAMTIQAPVGVVTIAAP